MPLPKPLPLRRGAFWCLAAMLGLLATTPLAAADFSFHDREGKLHRLSDYRGKWVLVNFWATWCTPCLSEIPELSNLHDTRQDLVVIGIALHYKSAKVVDQFSEAHGITYPVVLGNKSIEQQFGKVAVLPTSYLYNSVGDLEMVHRGELTQAMIETYLPKYLPQKNRVQAMHPTPPIP